MISVGLLCWFLVNSQKLKRLKVAVVKSLQLKFQPFLKHSAPLKVNRVHTARTATQSSLVSVISFVFPFFAQVDKIQTVHIHYSLSLDSFPLEALFIAAVVTI